MKQLLITFGLLLVIEFTTTVAYQREHDNKRGLINVVLRIGSKTFDDITATATKIEGSKPPQWEKSGGFQAALKDYVALMGKEISNINEQGKIVKVKDMKERGYAVVRNISSEGAPTLELQKPGGSPKIKAIRYRD